MGASFTNNPSAASPQPSAQPTNSLAGESLSAGSTNRTTLRTNFAALATAGLIAAGTNEVANAQTNAAVSPQHGAPVSLVAPGTNQVVYTSAQLPGQPAQPAQQVVNIKESTVSELKGLTSVYDAKGRELPLNRSVVPSEGDSKGGSPSPGEVVRLIATGVQELKAKNGGVIPADEVVVVKIQGKFGPTVMPINADRFPRPDRVSEQAYRVADRDPANHKAIWELSEPKGDLMLRITHEAGGVATIKYSQPVIFELVKKK